MPHFLVRMTATAFDGIPNKVVPRTVRIEDPALESPRAKTWIFSGYCEKLLYKNEKLKEFLQPFAGKYDDPECRKGLTKGQHILYLLSALNGQVNNGGLTQFFWNCPDFIFEVSEALEALGDTALAKVYEKALEGLISNKEDWIELRKKAGNDPGNFWEPFQQTYELLDIGWFDDAYFETYGPSLVEKLLNYVRDHKEEFLEMI